MPMRASTTTATGTSNAMPNTRNSVSTVPKYCSISGAVLIELGATATMNRVSAGITMKKQNATPTKNSTVLEITSGITIFFSCEYKPGATNAHTWYSTTGNATRNAAINVIFNGTRNGENTLVAISLVPAGRLCVIGDASRSYSPAGPGHTHNAMNTTITAPSARINRSRNSTRCVTKGASVPASSSFGSSVAIASPSPRARRPEARHPRRSGLGLAADALALLEPHRRGTALEAPLLVGPLVGRRRRRQRRHRRGTRLEPGSGAAPTRLERLARLTDLALHRASGCRWPRSRTASSSSAVLPVRSND